MMLPSWFYRLVQSNIIDYRMFKEVEDSLFCGYMSHSFLSTNSHWSQMCPKYIELFMCGDMYLLLHDVCGIVCAVSMSQCPFLLFTVSRLNTSQQVNQSIVNVSN